MVVILEETVDAALKEQRQQLCADFTRQTDALQKSRSWWRRAALVQGAVIAAAASTFILIHR